MIETASGPTVFAYDGSELAGLAIEEAGKQLRPGRDALVLTVWQTFNVGFVPSRELKIDAANTPDVQHAAEDTAATGAELAKAAGFRATALAKEAASVWKCIVDVADDRDASLIVLGSHGRSGFPDVLLGSVALAVAAHTLIEDHERERFAGTSAVPAGTEGSEDGEMPTAAQNAGSRRNESDASSE